MPITLILRLLAADGSLLGWGFQPTVARGDGALWPTGPCAGWGEATGTVVQVLVHWADVHVQVRATVEPFALAKNVPFRFQWTSGAIMRLDNPGDHPPLAAVTLHAPVTVDVPVGTMGLLGQR